MQSTTGNHATRRNERFIDGAEAQDNGVRSSVVGCIHTKGEGMTISELRDAIRRMPMNSSQTFDIGPGVQLTAHRSMLVTLTPGHLGPLHYPVSDTGELSSARIYTAMLRARRAARTGGAK